MSDQKTAIVLPSRRKSCWETIRESTEEELQVIVDEAQNDEDETDTVGWNETQTRITAKDLVKA